MTLVSLLPGGAANGQARALDQTGPVICWQVVDAAPLERAGGDFSRGPDLTEREGRILAGRRWLEASAGVGLGRPLLWGIDDPAALSLLRPDRRTRLGDGSPHWLEIHSEDPQLFLVARGGNPFAPATELRLGAGRALWITARDGGSGVKSLAVGTGRVMDPEPSRCDGWDGAGHILEATAVDVAGNRECVRWPLLAPGESDADEGRLPVRATRAPTCSAVLMPDLRNVRLEEATALLRSAGFVLGPIRYRQSWLAPGMVLGQDPSPEPGRRLPGEAPVTLEVGRRPPSPELVGKTLEEAERELGDTPLSLDLGPASETVEAGRRAGTVYRVRRQRPGAGEPIPGDRLGVEVEVEVAVPDLLDRSPQEAGRRLEDAGLARGRGFESGAGLRVAGQAPAADRWVPLGTTVDVELVAAIGESPVEVPDLRSVALREAKRRVEDAGLRAGAGFERARGQAEALVLGQAPEGGALAARGSAVTVEPGTRVPNLLAETLAGAARRLAAAGLSAGAGFEGPAEPSSDAADLLVVEQSPAGGTPARFGAPVDIVVGTRVPEVILLHAEDAIRRLTAARLTLGSALSLPTTITSLRGEPVTEGAILTQHPPPGEVVPVGSGVDVATAGGMVLPIHRWPWLWIVVLTLLAAALALGRVTRRRLTRRAELRVEPRRDPGVQSVRMHRRPQRAGGRLEIRLRARRDQGRAEIESTGILIEREIGDGV